MPTQHVHRLYVIIPAARCNAVNAWIKANLNPEGGDWFTPCLSADGNAPHTHAHCDAALTDAELKLLLRRLVQIASLDLPANWDTRTRAQKKAWFATQRDAVNTNVGIYIEFGDNDGSWPDAAAAMAAKGVTTRQGPP